MKKSKVLIVANWKMNPPTLADARVLFGKVKRISGKSRTAETVVCPPFIYLGKFSGGKNLQLGAQDVFWQNGGRATGEISPEMLKDSGVSSVLIGHSERRALGETDEVISKKALAVLREGLRAILCVGELERDSNGAYFESLRDQLKKSLAGIQPRFLKDLVIAYEPVWAVGKSYKESMTPADIKETAIFIRKVLSDIYGQDHTVSIPILYGGAVEPENVSAVLREGGVSGVLIGHKSLVAEDFIAILKSADAV